MKLNLFLAGVLLTSASAFAQQAVETNVVNEDSKSIVTDIAPQYNWMYKGANTYGAKVKLAVSNNKYVYVPVSFAIGDGVKQAFAGIGIGEVELNRHFSISFEAALAATTFDGRYADAGNGKLQFDGLFNSILTYNLSKRIAIAGHINTDILAAFQMDADHPNQNIVNTDASGAGFSLRFRIGKIKK